MVSDSGDKIRMCYGSTQIFLLLKQNMNKLVTREHLLRKVPTDGSGCDNALDDSLNDCIDEIRHLVSDDRLKTIPHVGYLLTPDATIDETVGAAAERTVKISNFRTSTPSNRVRRPVPALIQELVFNSQWLICGYQRSPFVWIGTFVLIALLLLPSAGNTATATTTTGHLAYDRAEANACTTLFAGCVECIPSVWQTSPGLTHSNWFMSSACNPQ